MSVLLQVSKTSTFAENVSADRLKFGYLRKSTLNILVDLLLVVEYIKIQCSP